MQNYNRPPFFRMILFLCLGGSLTLGCQKRTQPTLATNGRISPTYQGPAETPYCASSISYANTVTITGTAQYQAREFFYNGPGDGGLGGAGTAKPIRRAEVRVTSSAGHVVQCAETNRSGEFSFQLPIGNASYVVSINSRAFNNDMRVSVLDAPERNRFYSLSTTVTASHSQSLGTLLAGVNGEILGASFNMLDQVLRANDYLRQEVSNCASDFTGCSNFSVAPKVSIYWEKGFNPGSYFNSGPVSFYIPGYSRLFILGGVNGDVNSSDTDHFDNSIILHEYAHFLEDVLMKSDSPGGAHNGNRIIDPRLAWSEGFANFFQAAVRNDPRYIDTLGNTDGSTDFIFYLDLETAVNDIPQFHSGGTGLGEGNFREFSVTRLLWDALDDTPGEIVNGAPDDVEDAFNEIWTVLTKSTQGWLNPIVAFRDVGLFHLGQRWLQDNASANDWSNLRTIEKHIGNRSEYAQYVTPNGGGCADFNIDPQKISGDDGSFSTSDLFRNNKFYHYRHTATSTVTFRLEYEEAVTCAPADNRTDLDLYIYNKNARFGNSQDWVAFSRDEPNAACESTSSEQVTVSNLPAGDYLINVMVYTGPLNGRLASDVGMESTFRLKTNGVQLCPDDYF